ncbi:MAG: ribonuclease II [Deltaproteobacteria bacterium]|nr:MAG: ribonuclease II [Deltaproteobacteria bacterium]
MAMKPGTLVEYIDQQKIICAAVIGVKNNRLRLITETSKELNLTENRLVHVSQESVDTTRGKETLLARIREAASERSQLTKDVDVVELWEVVHDEQDWIDLDTLTSLAFPDPITDSHASAVMRALFFNKRYFKFHTGRFFPKTAHQVEESLALAAEAERRRQLVEDGAAWLRDAVNNPPPADTLDADAAEWVSLLKNYYLFASDSKTADLAKSMLQQAGVAAGDALFQFMVHMGIWEPDENLEMLRHQIPVYFSADCKSAAAEMVGAPPFFSGDPLRQDLTHLDLITIDGQSTLDFDDALSLEKTDDGYRLGIHIIDVAHFIGKGAAIDKAALNRGSSIYMPDAKVPMLPAELSEHICCLKKGELRPAISTLVYLDERFTLSRYEIVPSAVIVKHQLSYFDANRMLDTHDIMRDFHRIALHLREKRFESGATQIQLPEINVWLAEDGSIQISRIMDESPSRFFVSEMMILANRLMADFLKAKNLPAVFRSQPEPKARLYKGNEGTLFQHYMQRRQLSRVVISPEPDPHAGLGVPCYVTATSPIRKYHDLITQRQIKAGLGLSTDPYTEDEIRQLIALLEHPLSAIGKVQSARYRYWLLKYLEPRKGEREEAMVMDKRRDGYTVLLLRYMLDCRLPASGLNLKPQDLVHVVIQHVDARKDLFSAYVA